MMFFLAFFGSLAPLLVEGWCAGGFFVRTRRQVCLRLFMAFPLASLLNVLLFFVYTLLAIPLSAPALWSGHLSIIALLLVLRRLFPPPDEGSTQIPASLWKMSRIFSILCWFILGSALIYGFAHSTLLPPFQYDSMTNWLMRSKMSFLEHRILFDNAFPHDAIRKPTYPFLVHALHIAANAGQSSWHDAMATGMTFLLSVSLLGSAYALLKRIIGHSLSLAAITLVVGIPLLGVHLGEGYADHLLAEFGFAALAAFAVHRSAASPRMLMLSALLASAAVWTKAEGLFFVFLPWLALVLVSVWPLGTLRKSPSTPLPSTSLRAGGVGFPLLLAAIAAGLWPAFLLLKGFAFTPHGSSDLLIDYQPESLRTMLSVLLFGGSFGVFWPLLLTGTVCLAVASVRHSSGTCAHAWSLLLPGILSFAVVIGIYVFTPNVSYLLNGESFDRQLLTPAAMLACGVVVWFASFVKRQRAME